MINFTTPTIDLTVEGLDLSSYDVYVTLEQVGKKLTKSGNDLNIETETVGQKTNTNISFDLTQTESAMFNYKLGVDVQVNYIKGGVRKATDIEHIAVMKNLLNEVIGDEA